jgi:hypothetical protein
MPPREYASGFVQSRGLHPDAYPRRGNSSLPHREHRNSPVGEPGFALEPERPSTKQGNGHGALVGSMNTVRVLVAVLPALSVAT